MNKELDDMFGNDDDDDTDINNDNNDNTDINTNTTILTSSSLPSSSSSSSLPPSSSSLPSSSLSSSLSTKTIFSTFEIKDGLDKIGGGRGCFALTNIDAGTLILAEVPVMSWTSEVSNNLDDPDVLCKIIKQIINDKLSYQVLSSSSLSSLSSLLLSSSLS